MVEQVQAWRTSNGQLFTDQVEAENAEWSFQRRKMLVSIMKQGSEGGRSIAALPARPEEIIEWIEHNREALILALQWPPSPEPGTRAAPAPGPGQKPPQ